MREAKIEQVLPAPPGWFVRLREVSESGEKGEPWRLPLVGWGNITRPGREFTPVWEPVVFHGRAGQLVAVSEYDDHVEVVSIELAETPDALAQGLWALLDHIDTLDDACRGNDAAFREQTRKFVQRRFEYFDSDGYTLTRRAISPKGDPPLYSKLRRYMDLLVHALGRQDLAAVLAAAREIIDACYQEIGRQRRA